MIDLLGKVPINYNTTLGAYAITRCVVHNEIGVALAHRECNVSLCVCVFLFIGSRVSISK